MGNIKLTANDIVDIMTMKAQHMSDREIARIKGVSPTTISKVWKNPPSVGRMEAEERGVMDQRRKDMLDVQMKMLNAYTRVISASGLKPYIDKLNDGEPLEPDELKQVLECAGWTLKCFKVLDKTGQLAGVSINQTNIDQRTQNITVESELRDIVKLLCPVCKAAILAHERGKQHDISDVAQVREADDGPPA